MTVSTHFDGKVIVPDEPLDLPPNQALRVPIEPLEGEGEESALAWIALMRSRTTRFLPIWPISMTITFTAVPRRTGPEPERRSPRFSVDYLERGNLL